MRFKLLFAAAATTKLFNTTTDEHNYYNYCGDSARLQRGRKCLLKLLMAVNIYFTTITTAANFATGVKAAAAAMRRRRWWAAVCLHHSSTKSRSGSGESVRQQ